MNRFIFLCILLGVAPRLYSQDPPGSGTTTDRIIEGGNLIIEILKVISNSDSDRMKSSESSEPDCATANFTNICFVNRTSNIIIVRMKKDQTEKEHELFITNNGKECCYRITPGVYEYSIGQRAEGTTGERLIRKGELLLEVCKDLEIKIR
jgi:hypothetical protein